MLYSTLISKRTEAPACKGLLEGGDTETMRMSSLATAGIANPNNRIAEIRIATRKRMMVMELFSGVRTEYSGPALLASETTPLEGLGNVKLIDRIRQSDRFGFSVAE